MQSTTSSTRTFITPPPTAKKPEKKRKLPPLKQYLNRKNLPWIIAAVLILICLFLFVQYHSAQNKLSGGNSAKQTTALVARVGKIAVLPAGETPTVATVVHADRLHNQIFFANAQDGDKVLVFSKEKQAILYRPSTNQIVTIAPVNVAPDTTNLSK